MYSTARIQRGYEKAVMVKRGACKAPVGHSLKPTATGAVCPLCTAAARRQDVARTPPPAAISDCANTPAAPLTTTADQRHDAVVHRQVPGHGRQVRLLLRGVRQPLLHAGQLPRLLQRLLWHWCEPRGSTLPVELRDGTFIRGCCALHESRACVQLAGTWWAAC